jgi:hypothetical protein
VRWPRITLRWAMTRIAVIAVALAILAVAENESRASGCGTPTLLAVALLALLAILYEGGRLIVFAIRRPS